MSKAMTGKACRQRILPGTENLPTDGLTESADFIRTRASASVRFRKGRPETQRRRGDWPYRSMHWGNRISRIMTGNTPESEYAIDTPALAVRPGNDLRSSCRSRERETLKLRGLQ
jgi:hypothetical protein